MVTVSTSAPVSLCPRRRDRLPQWRVRAVIAVSTTVGSLALAVSTLVLLVAPPPSELAVPHPNSVPSWALVHHGSAASSESTAPRPSSAPSPLPRPDR